MNCEQIRMAAMAMADGESSPIPPREVEAHIAVCAECQAELAGIAALCRSLDAQRRAEWTPDQWTAIEGQLARPPARALWIGGALLVCFELLVLIPDRQLSMAFEIAPLLIGLGVFGWLRQNPFRINTELRLEEEEL